RRLHQLERAVIARTCWRYLLTETSSARSDRDRRPGKSATTIRTPRHSGAGGTSGTSQLLQAKNSSADPATRPQPAPSSCLAKYAASSIGGISVRAVASADHPGPPPPTPDDLIRTPGG